MIKAGLSNKCKLWIKTLNLSSNQLNTSSIDVLIDLTCAIRIQNLIICNNQLLDRDIELLCRNCKNLEFLCLEDENIFRADQMLIKFFMILINHIYLLFLKNLFACNKPVSLYQLMLILVSSNLCMLIAVYQTGIII